MSAAVSKSIVDLLIAGGVESREEAAQLAQNLNGGSWTTQVLDSGKVDEQRFLVAIGNFFRVPVVSIDAKTIDRADALDFARAVCFSASHPADRGEGKFGRARDLRSFQFDRPPARVATFEKASRVGPGAARPAPARDENALRRRRGNIR